MLKLSLFVINGEGNDNETFRVDEMMVEHCTSYTY